MIRAAVTAVAIVLGGAVGLAAADGWGAWSFLATIPAALFIGLGAGWLADLLGRRYR